MAFDVPTSYGEYRNRLDYLEGVMSGDKVDSWMKMPLAFPVAAAGWGLTKLLTPDSVSTPPPYTLPVSTDLTLSGVSQLDPALMESVKRQGYMDEHYGPSPFPSKYPGNMQDFRRVRSEELSDMADDPRYSADAERLRWMASQLREGDIVNGEDQRPWWRRIGEGAPMPSMEDSEASANAYADAMMAAEAARRQVSSLPEAKPLYDPKFQWNDPYLKSLYDIAASLRDTIYDIDAIN